MKKARHYLALVIGFAIGVRVLWWSIEPVIPYIISAAATLLVLVTIFGVLVYRRR